MKYAKMLGIAAMALAALMAFAGIASATRVTSPAGTLYTGTIKATSTNTELHNSFSFGTIKCGHSEVEGSVTSHGSGVTAIGSISKLTFTNCTNGKPTSPVVNRGTLEVHYTSGSNGTATSNNAEVIIHETLVGTCIFKTKNTDIGTVVGGTTAKLEINSSTIPQSGGNPFCPSSATWTGTYTVNTPDTLLLDS